MQPVIAVIDDDLDILGLMEILPRWAGYQPLV